MLGNGRPKVVENNNNNNNNSGNIKYISITIKRGAVWAIIE
jgi:hypothetical protein